MKKIIISILTITLLFSFLYGQDAGQSVRVVILPNKSTDFLKKYFKSDEIDYATMNNLEYVITLKSGVVINFLKDGDWKIVDGSFKPIRTDFMDNKIIKLVKQQHPKAKVLKIEKTYGGYDILLDNRVKLEFDLDGILLKQGRDG